MHIMTSDQATGLTKVRSFFISVNAPPPSTISTRRFLPAFQKALAPPTSINTQLLLEAKQAALSPKRQLSQDLRRVPSISLSPVLTKQSERLRQIRHHLS